MPRARRRSMAAVAAVVLVTGLATALAGCSSDAPETDPGSSVTPAAEVAGLRVEVRQGRFDVPDGVLVVSFANEGDESVTVERAEVRSPALEPGMERTRPFDLAPGDRLDVRMPLTASVCDARPDTVVAVEFHADGGSDGGTMPATAVLVPTDPYDTMARIADRDCLAESVAAAATIVLPERLRTAGSGTDARAVIDVRVEPAASGDAAVTIDRVLGTTLIGSESGGAWPVGLAVEAGDAVAGIELPVRPARCDAHAIADDKRGTILPFELATSDGRAGVLELASGDALKADLYAYYAERCGLD
ncbi:hypothetical protein [Agromyces sp. ZXT2-6]|uniref:hypothetical protein n=1 Tax=Agromyces sp. ZXT2-6 TaxID=3461153 RepID=UPI0040552EBC